MARVLILGGTGEARALAAELPGHEVISSLAGRVTNPALPVGDVRIGGFGGAQGLANWLRDNHIDVVVDATHPFAARITENAASACHSTATPHLVLRRPAWELVDAEHVPNMAAAATVIPPSSRVFVTTGRGGLHALADIEHSWFLIRTVDPPDGPLPPHHECFMARGPYTVDGECALMEQHGITLLLTKNSGGALTEAKLDAARSLGVRIAVIDRPALPADVTVVSSVDDAREWVNARG